MRQIGIFAGTTEGRDLLYAIKNLPYQVHYMTATEYGKELAEEIFDEEKDDSVIGKFHFYGQAMDRHEMKDFLQKRKISLVIDGTHPFAVQATENIKAACEALNIEYIRLLRETKTEELETENLHKKDQNRYFSSIEEAIAYLETTEGNIFISTGGNDLFRYKGLTDFEKRCYARVLSTRTAVEKAEEAGFKGAHLFAMQGPFSKEMNVAILKQVEAKYFVTKESGVAGGFLEKVSAAKECKVELVVVRRPKEEGKTKEEILLHLQNLVKETITSPLKVALIGIGPGGEMDMTLKARQFILSSDVIIGAKRMLQAATFATGTKEVAYLPEDIFEKIRKHPKAQKIAVLFSGDVSFYSGAKKTANFLKEREINPVMFPGISSVSYFAAVLQKDFQEVPLLSLHGRKENVIMALEKYGRVFVLIDRIETIKRLCKELCLLNKGNTTVCIGSKLSYREEYCCTKTARELILEPKWLEKVEDLSILYLEKEEEASRMLPVTQGLQDALFIRGKVPMTKQEVRSVVLSYLELQEDSSVLEVGAGTGSVTVEMARLLTKGEVLAIERNEEGVCLIRENATRFGQENITVLEGSAPGIFKDEEFQKRKGTFSHVFIGGSGGNLQEILSQVWNTLRRPRIVMTAITMETVALALDFANAQKDMTIKFTQMTVSSSDLVGEYHMMRGHNPIVLIVLEEKRK